MNESLSAQKAEIEQLLKNETMKEKVKDERIAQLVQELADERVELSNAQSTIDETKRNLEIAQKQNLDQLKVTERTVNQLQQLERALQSVQSEFSEFQKTKKIEDLLTVKFEVDQFNAEMLTSPTLDMQQLETTKSELESQVSRVCRDFSLVISTERTLTDKVRMFQEKCTNLETALESANNVSSVEIRALKREITLCTDKNDNLNTAYEELKKQHEAMLFERETEIERSRKNLEKQLKDSEQKRTTLDK